MIRTANTFSLLLLAAISCPATAAADDAAPPALLSVERVGGKFDLPTPYPNESVIAFDEDDTARIRLPEDRPVVGVEGSAW